MFVATLYAIAATVSVDTIRADSTRAPGPDSTRTVRVGGFVDTYYAWDTGRPRARDRAFTTQPARHNEFNVNLAHVEVVLAQPRLRARLALQAGTSVQVNYAGEPRVGAVSGGELSRHLQEATAGVQLHESLWLDAGTYFSHIGLEGWISRDNPTYTRSLVADYTPYYLSGARLTWQATPRVTAQLHVVNGWQNMSETNGDKALGTRLDVQASPALMVGWRTFLGNEQPDGAPSRLRMLQQVVARWTPPGWEWTLVLDAGRQARAGDGHDTWHGGSLVGRRAVSQRAWLVGRVESLADPARVLVATPRAEGFRTRGGSLGVDLGLQERALWRTEVRTFRSGAAIWPASGGGAARSATLLVTSLAVTL